MNNQKFSSGHYVIKDGKLIGEFEKLYQNIEDPWNQSEKHNIKDTCRQISIMLCKRLSESHGANRIIELGCGFGFITDQLRQRGFDSIGIDISETAILKAREKNPSSNFEVRNYNDFEFYSRFNPDIIIMAQLTWYILDTLDEFLSALRTYALSRQKPTFLIHLLATYKPGTQEYGTEKFTNLDENLKYFNMQYLEYGFIKTVRDDDPDSQSTYFIAKIA